MVGMSEFLKHLRDLLTGPDGLANLDIRRAFNGHGLYEAGVLFGWVWDDADELQLKQVVERTRAGKQKRVSYAAVPAEALEDRSRLLELVRATLEELP